MRQLLISLNFCIFLPEQLFLLVLAPIILPLRFINVDIKDANFAMQSSDLLVALVKLGGGIFECDSLVIC